MKIKITDKASSFLADLMEKVKDKVAINTVLGKEAEVRLRKHFLTLNKKPNAKGFKKQYFWRQIRTATTLGEINDKGATVNISDSRFAIKVYGGTIKPTGGKKYLAIPATSQRYGTSPQSANDRDDLVFIKRNTSEKAYLIKKENKAIRVQYFLVRSSTQKPQADALPDKDKFSQNLSQALKTYFR